MTTDRCAYCDKPATGQCYHELPACDNHRELTSEEEAHMNPTPKAPELVKLMEPMTGRKRNGKTCMLCGSPKMSSADFRDALSRRKARISCMCQKCQDSVFDAPTDEED